MVKLVARQAIDTSDLYQLSMTPIGSTSISVEIKGKNGYVTRIVVEQDGSLAYKMTKLDLKTSKTDTFFQGDFEPKLFSKADIFSGSGAGDTLYSYRGNDAVKGRGGDDMIFGGNGKDMLKGQAGNDSVSGDNGKDTLEGNGGDDVLDGGNGKDLLNGGVGANTLTGGNGKDRFLFDATLDDKNNSSITDFETGVDTILLAKSAFPKIGKKGDLGNAKFVLADDYAGEKNVVVYDKATGLLSYATGGDTTAFGAVSTALSLSHDDFMVV